MELKLKQEDIEAGVKLVLEKQGFKGSVSAVNFKMLRKAGGGGLEASVSIDLSEAAEQVPEPPKAVNKPEPASTTTAVEPTPVKGTDVKTEVEAEHTEPAPTKAATPKVNGNSPTKPSLFASKSPH